MLKDMQEAHLIEKMAKNDKVSYKDKEGTCFRKRPYYRWAIYAELNQKTDKGYMNAYRRLLTEDRELKKSFDLDEFIKNLPPKLRRGLDQIKLDTGKSDSEIINCILQEKGIKPETVRQIAKQLIDKKQE